MIEIRFDPWKPHLVVLYVRMSDPKQNPRSPEQQIAEIKAVLARLGYPWVIIKVYRDDGISGRLIRDRPGFQSMMREIAAGIIKPSLIAVDTSERFGRAKELDAIRTTLETDYGVLIVAANNHFADPTGSQGRLTTVFENYRATEEGRVKAHQVLRGKRDTARLKRWPGGPAPLGYKLQAVTPPGGDVASTYNILVPHPEDRFIIEKIFKLADETGWGATRIANALNSDPSIPECFKPLTESTVSYIVDNDIYMGTLVYGENRCDIIKDRRVVRPVEDAREIERVEGFCEPLIAPEVFARIQERKARRAAAWMARQEPKEGRLIRPLTPGISLVYPLAGLVRCGVCGSAMTARPSGRKSRSGTTYVYYSCPRGPTDACTNRRHVREALLWPATVSAVRSQLFPVGGVVGTVPEWLPTIFSLVEQELVRQKESQPLLARQIEEEIKKHSANISGWTGNLGDRSLPSVARNHLQQALNDALTKITELEATLAQQEAVDRQMRQVLDPGIVVKGLQELDRVLAGSNINAINIELSKHIAYIQCGTDATVKLVGTRLGLFDGAVNLLSRREGSGAGMLAPADGVVPVAPRRLTPRRVDTLTGSDQIDPEDARMAISPDRFAGLPEGFLWTTQLAIEDKPSWAQENAQFVLEKYHEHKELSLTKLAKLLGKSRWVITDALCIAKGEKPAKRAGKESGRRRGPREPDTRDPKELARQARALYDAKKLNKEISLELNIPKGRLLELLRSTFTDGEMMVDGRIRRLTLASKQMKVPMYKDLAEKVHTLEEKGMSLKDIGAQLNINATVLTKIRRYWAESHGVEFVDGRARRKTLPR